MGSEFANNGVKDFDSEKLSDAEKGQENSNLPPQKQTLGSLFTLANTIRVVTVLGFLGFAIASLEATLLAGVDLDFSVLIQGEEYNREAWDRLIMDSIEEDISYEHIRV